MMTMLMLLVVIQRRSGWLSRLSFSLWIYILRMYHDIEPKKHKLIYIVIEIENPQMRLYHNTLQSKHKGRIVYIIWLNRQYTKQICVLNEWVNRQSWVHVHLYTNTFLRIYTRLGNKTKHAHPSSGLKNRIYHTHCPIYISHLPILFLFLYITMVTPKFIRGGWRACLSVHLVFMYWKQGKEKIVLKLY